MTQHRLLLTELHLEMNKKYKDTTVYPEKIKWYKVNSDEGVVYMNTMKEWLQDVINAEEELDASQMWMALQEVAVLKAKELRSSKGSLKTRKEAWLWKDEQVRNAVKEKKLL